MNTIFKTVLALRTIYTIAMLILVTLVLLPFQLLAMLLGLSMQAKIPFLWHKIMSRVLRLHITPVGEPTKKRPLLLVANHQNWMDILVLGSVMPVSFIAKAEIKGWAGFGWLAQLQRTVFVDREKRSDTKKSASEISARLIKGDAMVLFAEGTTSDGNRVLPFKTALFGSAQIAKRESGLETVSVQTAVLSYSKIRGGAAGREGRKALAWYGNTDLVPHILQVLGMGPIGVEVHFGQECELTSDTDRKQLALACEQEAQENFAIASGFKSLV